MTRFVVCIFSLSMLASTSWAQPAATELKLLHKPIKASELPFPGEKLELRVLLQGLRNINLPLRAFVVSDGRLMDLPLSGTLDEQDRVVYNVVLPAPLAEINYQFFLYRDEETVLPTQRFSIQRTCLPEIKLTDMQSGELPPGKGMIKELVARAKGLERDVKTYTRLSETLEALKAVLPKTPEKEGQ